MRAYKLIDAIDTPVSFNAWATGKNGMRKLMPGRLVPNREYYDYLDDPVFVAWLYDAHQKFNHTQDFENRLKRDGIRYEIPKRSCSCQPKKIDVWFVEVIE